MQPEVACPRCQNRIANPPELQGQIVACPFCAQQFRLTPAGPVLQAQTMAAAPAPGIFVTDSPRFQSPAVAAPTASATGAAEAPGKDKSPGLALVLSFLLPGLGQFYNGQILKGLAVLASPMVLGAIGFGIIVSIISSAPEEWEAAMESEDPELINAMLGTLVGPSALCMAVWMLIFCWQLYDSYATAKATNRRRRMLAGVR